MLPSCGSRVNNVASLLCMTGCLRKVKSSKCCRLVLCLYISHWRLRLCIRAQSLHFDFLRIVYAYSCDFCSKNSKQRCLTLLAGGECAT